MKHKQLFLHILIGFATIALFWPLPVIAATFEIEVSPQTITIFTTKDKTQEITIDVFNPSSESQNIFLGIKPFQVSEHGHIEYTGNADSSSELIQSIRVLDKGKQVTELTLAPHERKSLTLFVPALTQTLRSDTYTTLFFLSNPPLKQQNISTEGINAESLLQGGIGIHLLFTREKISKKVRIESFISADFVEYGPIQLQAKLANKGSYLFTGKAEITITNMFGQTIASIAVPTLRVLAGSSKQLADKPISWNDTVLIGPYVATLTLFDTQGTQVQSMQTHFFVFPVKLVAFAGAILMAIILVVSATQRKRKIK